MLAKQFRILAVSFPLASVKMRSSIVLFALPLGFAAPQKRALLLRPRNDAEAIPNKYIVKLRDDVTTASFDKTLLSRADQVFNGAFNGFAATLKTDALEALLDDPSVCAFPLPLVQT